MTLLIFFDTPFPSPYSSLSLLFICNLSAYIFMLKVPLLKKYNIIEYLIYIPSSLWSECGYLAVSLYTGRNPYSHMLNRNVCKICRKTPESASVFNQIERLKHCLKKCHMVVFFTIIFQIVQNKLFKRTFPRNH